MFQGFCDSNFDNYALWLKKQTKNCSKSAWMTTGFMKVFGLKLQGKQIFWEKGEILEWE